VNGRAWVGAYVTLFAIGAFLAGVLWGLR